MTRLLQWLIGDASEELDRRRAMAYAIRAEMDAHPVEREEFPRGRHVAAIPGLPRRASAQAYTRELTR